MSLKTFCDICLKEIKNRDNEIYVWSNPSKHFCIKCWINKRNWSKIHKASEALTKRKNLQISA